MAQEVVGEVSLWGSLVDAWIDSHDPSALVHLYRQVDELYTNHNPYVINSGTLVKSKAGKTMCRFFMQKTSIVCLLGEACTLLPWL